MRAAMDAPFTIAIATGGMGLLIGPQDLAHCDLRSGLVDVDVPEIALESRRARP